MRFKVHAAEGKRFSTTVVALTHAREFGHKIRLEPCFAPNMAKETRGLECTLACRKRRAEESFLVH